MCPVEPDGKVNLQSIGPVPIAGPKGTTFVFTATLDIVRPVGAGEVTWVAWAPDGKSYMGSEGSNHGVVLPGAPADVQWSLKAVDSPPGTLPFIYYKPGDYNVSFTYCQGICGGTHSHETEYVKVNTTFTISPN